MQNKPENAAQLRIKIHRPFADALLLAVETVAKLNGKLVFAVLQQMTYVIAAVVDPVGGMIVQGIGETLEVARAIIAESRHKTVVADRLSVQACLKIAKARYKKFCPAHL